MIFCPAAWSPRSTIALGVARIDKSRSKSRHAGRRWMRRGDRDRNDAHFSAIFPPDIQLYRYDTGRLHRARQRSEVLMGNGGVVSYIRDQVESLAPEATARLQVERLCA